MNEEEQKDAAIKNAVAITCAATLDNHSGAMELLTESLVEQDNLDELIVSLYKLDISHVPESTQVSTAIEACCVIREIQKAMFKSLETLTDDRGELLLSAAALMEREK